MRYRQHDLEFWENKRKLENYRKERDSSDKSESNKRLSNIIRKNFETVIIGAIAEFEDSFGYIWGIDKEGDELTDKEKVAREVWEDVRKTILDKGNNKKRASLRELSNHDVKWNKYRYDFKVKE